MLPITDSLVPALLIIGALLVMAEAFIPGAHFIVLGVALFLTGLVALLFGGGPITLLIVFLIVSILTLLGYRNLELYGTEQGTTSDSSDLESQEAVVTQRVTQTDGQVELIGSGTGMSSTYQARAPVGEIPEDTRVLVTDAGGGSILEVMPLEDNEFDEMLGMNEETELEEEFN